MQDTSDTLGGHFSPRNPIFTCKGRKAHKAHGWDRVGSPRHLCVCVCTGMDTLHSQGRHPVDGLSDFAATRRRALVPLETPAHETKPAAAALRGKERKKKKKEECSTESSRCLICVVCDTQFCGIACTEMTFQSIASVLHGCVFPSSYTEISR